MTFASPWWLLLLGLALAVLALHVRRRREVPVGSILLWRHLTSDAAPRPTRRLPPLTLPLILQLLLLALVVFALARPLFTAGESSVEHVIVVLDGSTSMLAGDVAPSRFEQARSVAEERLATLPEEARFTLLTAAERSGVVAARVPRMDAVAALAEAAAAGGRPDWEEAARLASGTVRENERTLLLILSDASGSTTATTALGREFPGVESEVTTLGAGASNVGFASVGIEPVDLEEGSWQVSGELVRSPDGPNEVEVNAMFEPRGSEGALPWGSVSVDLASGTPAPFTLDLELPGPGTLELLLPGDDDLAADDAALITIEAERRQAEILYVGAGNPPLLRALSAVEGAEVFQSDELPVNTREYDLVVIDSVDVDERPGTDSLWLATAPPGANGNEQLANPQPTGWNVEHPLAQDIDWSRLEVERALDLPVLAGATVLLEAAGAPLVQTRATAEGRETVLAFALADSSWPAQLSFPLFVARLVELAEPGLGRAAFVQTRFHPLESSLAAPVGEGAADEAAPGVAGAAGVAQSEGISYPTANWAPWRYLLLAALALLVAEALLSGLGRERFLRPERLSRSNPLAGRYRLIIALQLAALVSLLLAILDAPLPYPERDGRAVLVVDDARFLGPAASSRIDSLANDAPAGRLGVVALGGRSRIVRAVGEEAPAVTTPAAADEAGANLAHALELAAGMLANSQEGRIAVVASGIQTSGDLEATVSRLRERGIPVDVAPTGEVPSGEVLVEALFAPERPWVSQEFGLEGIVFSEAEQTASLTIYRNGEELTRQEVDLLPGRNRIETNLTQDEPGWYLFEMEIGSDSDVFSQNDRAGSWVEVSAPSSILLVTPQVQWGELLADALAVQGIEVEVVTPVDAPWSVEGWLEQEAAILMNVPALDLHSVQQQALSTWVAEHGGGLIIMGGENSFGPGGYYQTELEEISPLSSRVPREAPVVALQFVLDRSGSMQQAVGGVSRLDIAKEATIEAVDLLSEESLVGVVVFDAEASVLLPVQTIGAREELIEALGGLGASGGTDIHPALELGFEEISQVDAPTRHVVLMTDGLSQPGDLTSVMERFREEEITVSSVAIGQGADALRLQNIARAGGGTFHATTDFQALPGILAQEALLLSGTPIEEGPIRPAWAGTDRTAQFLAGLPENLPPLHGYVLTTAKEQANVHLLAGEEDPLLASWRYGLGRVIAFTSHGAGSWSRDWLDLPEYPQLWTQAVLWTLPQVAGPGLNLRTQRAGDDVRLVVEAVSATGAPESALDLEAVLSPLASTDDDRTAAESPSSPVEEAAKAAAPTRSFRSTELNETTPGRYEATLHSVPPGDYLVEVRPVGTTQASAVASPAAAGAEATGQPGSEGANGDDGVDAAAGQQGEDGEIAGAAYRLHVSYPARFEFSSQDAGLLLDLAAATGGRVLLGGEELFPSEPTVRWQQRSVWPLWASGALLLFLLALIYRYAPNLFRAASRNRSGGRAGGGRSPGEEFEPT